MPSFLCLTLTTESPIVPKKCVHDIVLTKDKLYRQFVQNNLQFVISLGSIWLIPESTKWCFIDSELTILKFPKRTYFWSHKNFHRTNFLCTKKKYLPRAFTYPDVKAIHGNIPECHCPWKLERIPDISRLQRIVSLA